MYLNCFIPRKVENEYNTVEENIFTQHVKL